MAAAGEVEYNMGIMKLETSDLQVAANAIRVLVADMVEQANSGHPGGSMGQADVAATLWLEYLKVDPTNPLWVDRDRLVFSGGHCSPLVYSLFHLAGMDGLTLDEVKNFRQFGSRTAGHPEREQIRGIDVSTGPLGQGVAMGVGLALAAKMKAKTNRTWVLCGDGDMEEGVSHEACSFAGTLGLGGLTLVYDSNDITIEGRATISMTDDTAKRFESYGWRVVSCDGHDYDSIRAALDVAAAETAKPVLVPTRTSATARRRSTTRRASMAHRSERRSLPRRRPRSATIPRRASWFRRRSTTSSPGGRRKSQRRSRVLPKRVSRRAVMMCMRGPCRRSIRRRRWRRVRRAAR